MKPRAVLALRFAAVALLGGFLALRLGLTAWTLLRLPRLVGVTAGISEPYATSIHTVEAIRRAGGMRLSLVAPGGPAEKAGLRTGDIVTAINGTRLTERPGAYFAQRLRGRAGTVMDVTFRREGIERSGALLLEATTRKNQQEALASAALDSNPPWLAARSALWLLHWPFLLFPALLLLIAAPVGLLRAGNAAAYHVALLFLWLGNMILVGTPLQIAWPLWALASIGVAHGLSFLGIAGHSLELLAVFPNPSRLGRRALRWKWAILLPFGLVALCTAISQLQTLYGWTGAIPDLAAAIDRLVPPRILILCLALMPLSLLLAQRLETRGRPQARQRVIEAGFTLAIAGTLCSVIFPMSVAWRVFLPRGAGVAVVASLLALLIPLVLTYCLPLSMAYAVLAQRVFGFRSLVRRSVQHLLLSRGVLAVEGLALFVVLEEILRHAQRSAGSPGPLVAAVAAAGSLLTMGVMTRVNRPLMQRIDRRFFRESYDARRVLLGLAQRMTSLRETDEILRQAGGAILGALHPARVGFLLLPDAAGAPPPAREPAPSAAATEPGAARQGSAQPIVLADPLLAEPTRALEPGRDWIELPPSPPSPGEEPPPAPYELLVALPGSAGLLGSMALAAKLSEEPFSGEDRELLVTVATQMGLALENAALLEIARREAQQARDLEIARQVQQSLYPSDLPRAAGWEFTAASLPARAVGGDYFDLFEIAPGFLAVALGDVSGKGLGASLLMARTHAMIRGGISRGMGNLATLMEELNESLVASTPMTMYVTLFVGILETASGRLRYVNCGHLPPMLVGTGETLPARLEEGGTVLGMLEGSSYREGEARLDPGALLVLFSDGITEATGGAGEMFGESGLREALSRSRDLAACDIAPKVLEAVREFVGGGEQSDDISLLIVRRKP